MSSQRIFRALRGRRPRYADVTASLALLLAMGGTAYAASLGPNTVGTTQLKDHAVTASKIHGGAVTASKLGSGAVRTSKLGDGTVTALKLDAGAVTHIKLGANSVSGSNVAANSLSFADLVGADVNGTIGFSLSANGCGTLGINVGGAQVGQVVLFSFTGNVALPSSVVFGGTKVTATNMVSIGACNVGSSPVSVSDLGIHIATIG